MITTFLLDAVIIMLLGMAIVFCWRLNGRMGNMREMATQILPSVRDLSGFVSRINEQIALLRQQTKQTQTMLSHDIPKAKTMKDDLEVLLEFSEKSSVDLESLIKTAKETEQELRQIHELVRKTFPSNFKNSLERNEVDYDFDSLRQSQETMSKNDTLPLRIKPRPQSKETYNVDSSLKIAMGDIS